MELKKIKELVLKQPKISCIVLALIALIYACLFLGPEIKKLFGGLAECSQLKTGIIKVKEDWTNIDHFKERISQLKEKINYYEKKLPGEKEIPTILKYLSEAAKKMDVRITEIKPLKLEQEKSKDAKLFYYETPILLNAECGYHQLGRFLSKLESADRFMKIDDIKIVASPHKANIHHVRLTVLTYVMKK